jgi:hypothetical protein
MTAAMKATWTKDPRCRWCTSHLPRVGAGALLLNCLAVAYISHESRLHASRLLVNCQLAADFLRAPQNALKSPAADENPERRRQPQRSQKQEKQQQRDDDSENEVGDSEEEWDPQAQGCSVGATTLAVAPVTLSKLKVFAPLIDAFAIACLFQRAAIRNCETFVFASR